MEGYPPDLVPADIGGQIVALVPRHRASEAIAGLAAELGQAPAELRAMPDEVPPSVQQIGMEQAAYRWTHCSLQVVA